MIKATLEQAASAAGKSAAVACIAFRTAYTEVIKANKLPDGITEADIWKEAGKIFDVYHQAFFTATFDLYDPYGIPRELTPEEAEDGGACARCYCNSCDCLEACTQYPPADGITPPPCAKCGGMNPPLKRVEDAMPDCFTQITEDCKACWCWDCAVFENCIVDKPGYDPDSKPCPCDGCEKGERWMPKENPPCPNHTKGGERLANIQ